MSDIKWIHVSESLPEFEEEILFVWKARVYFGEYIWYDPGCRFRDFLFCDYHDDVRYWMPLPPIPDDTGK